MSISINRRMSISINPGSEPLEPGTYSPEQALLNMTAFIVDLEHHPKGNGVKATNLRVNPEAENDDGRFGFLIDVDGVSVDVEMPGWPMEHVRYLDFDDQNIWDFPRLYVDGNSGVWLFALGYVQSAVEDAST